MNKQAVFIAVGLFLVTLVVFGRAMTFDFVAYDDPRYVTANDHVQEGLTADGVSWAFTTNELSNWHPLTWLSLMLDVSLFGPEPGPMHLVNVVLHALATVVLFLALRQLTGAQWASALVAGLFALHPTRVESVVWISERKDVLSALFWGLTMWAYALFAMRGGAKWYGLALLACALGLMVKPMLVTLPCVLLLLDGWPLRRLCFPGHEPSATTVGLRRVVIEKLPFFALAAASCFMTVRAQQGAMTGTDLLPLADRLANASVAYVRYLGLLLAPHDMAVLYPMPRAGWAFGHVAGSVALLMVISVACLGMVRRRPMPLVGWLWFLGTMVPVIGIVQVGVQSMADRYAYVTFIGLFILIAFGLRDASTRWAMLRVPLVALSVASLLACGVVSWRQSEHWRDSETLFTHTLSVTDDNWMIHNNLGVALGEQSDFRGAGLNFLRVMEINPNDELAQQNLLRTVARLREGGASIEADLLSAIALAIEQQRAEPDAPHWSFNLGVYYRRLDELDRAIVHFERAVSLAPNDLEARLRLGATHQDRGDATEALRWYRRAIQLDESNPAAINTLAWFLATHTRDDLRDGVEAVRLVTAARDATQGRDPEAIIVLVAALAEAGRIDEARSLLDELFQGGVDRLPATLRDRARPLRQALERGTPLRDDASVWH